MDEINYINFKLISEDPVLVAKAVELDELYRAEKQSQRKSKKDTLTAFNSILTAIEIMGGYEGRVLHIPTNRNLYYATTKRSYTYTPQILSALKWLKKSAYLTKVEGIKFTVVDIGEVSRQKPFAYKLSEKWLKNISNRPMSDPSLIKRNTLTGKYVEVRIKVGEEKRIVEPSAEELKKHGGMKLATEELLRKYDDLMEGVSISLGSVAIPSAKTSMTRIFSRGSFEFGGRFYSELLYMRSKLRPYLYFDGEPTIEIDYASLHPHFLYHQDGLEFSGADPYEIEGVERKIVKKAFNTMLNRGGKHKRNSAVDAFVGQFNMTKDEAHEFEQTILALHEPIKHHFNRGDGLRLQRLDSDVAMQIIGHFINVKRRPIIGIHDSFIVSVRDTEALKLLMNDYYNALFKEQNDAVFDAIDWSGAEEGSGLDGVVSMSSINTIKERELHYSASLMDAVMKCFKGDTEGMDDKFWDDLLAKEPVQEPPA